MSCVKQTTKHYTERPSPPYPANTCCGAVRKGNDGRMYQSVADRNGVCRWILKSSATKSASKPKKIVKKKSTSKTKSTSKPKKVTKKSTSKPKKVVKKSTSKPKKVAKKSTSKPKKMAGKKKSRSRSASPMREKWITHEGKLGGHGYLHKSKAQRRKILDQCVKDWGYKSCLGSVLVLNRNKNIKALYGDIINEDKEYIMKKHGNHK